MGARGDASRLIDPDAIGVEVSWSFGCGDADAVRLPRDVVINVLGECDLGGADLYIPEKDSGDALKHAAKICRPGKHHIVRELERPRKDTPRAIGVYKVAAVEGESGDDVTCGARVRCEPRAVCLAPEGGAADDGCMRIGQRVADAANDLLDNAYNKDLSEMLLAIGDDLNWISRRRNKGGVYFVLARTEYERMMAERFVRLLKGLEALSALEDCEQFRAEIVEVYPKPLAMGTITEAARSSFEASIDRMTRELDRMTADGKMRETTIGRRADECDELIRRAEQYRFFLEGAVDKLAGRLGKIRDRFSAELSEAAESAKADINAIDDIEVAETAPLPKRGRRRVAASEWDSKPFDESFFDF